MKTDNDGWCVCDQCGNLLALYDGEEAMSSYIWTIQGAGFVAKNSILYSGKTEYLFFCCAPCQRTYYNDHGYTNPEITKALNEIRKDIPRMAAETARAVGKFKDFLLNLKNKK